MEETAVLMDFGSYLHEALNIWLDSKLYMDKQSSI